MDSPKKFNLNPLTMESEFRILSIRRRLHELSREELEEFLTEALSLLTNMANQLSQMKDYVEEIEGKTQEDT